MSTEHTDQLDAIKQRLERATPAPQVAENMRFIANAPADIRWLVGEVERLRATLAKVEWVGGSMSNEYFTMACHFCGVDFEKPHADDCEWVKAMGKQS